MGEKKPKTAKPPWPGIVLLVVGVLLVLGASVFAQRTGLGKSLVLDVKGVRTIGSAEPMGPGVYHIRYQHPTGTIYRHQYTGRLSGEPLPSGEIEIAVVFNPQKPNEFQPAGLSYLPGVIAPAVFVAGMWCVLKARTVMRRHYLRTAGQTEAKGPKKKGASQKPASPRQRLKLMRIVLSIMIVLFLLVLFYGCPQLNIPSIWDDNIVVRR